VICDSAGRLHNNDQLMENLNKNKRVLEKALPGSPHDTILVLDANTGQNMLSQGKKFLELGLTGLILTKLDGSAKGGAVIPLIQDLKLPILKVGVGEGEEDMMSFDPKNFSESMVGMN
jgi:fused signal recognition particle receptor